MSPSQYKRLDTLGMKELRSILKLPSAYYSHITGDAFLMRQSLKSWLTGAFLFVLCPMLSCHGICSSLVFVIVRCLPGVCFREGVLILPSTLLFAASRSSSSSLGGNYHPACASQTQYSSASGLGVLFRMPTLQDTVSVHGGPEDVRLGIAEAHILRTIRDKAHIRAAFKKDVL